MKVTIDIPKSALLKVVALADAYDELGEEKVNEFLASDEIEITNVFDREKESKDMVFAIAMCAFGAWAKKNEV